MRTRAALILLAVVPLAAADWNPRLAAQYLDGRQKLWVAWPRALESGVPCVSCHTSLPYLLARPALRGALGESGRTPYETELLDGVLTKLDKTSGPDLFPKLTKGPLAGQIYGTNIVLAAALLAMDDARSSRGMQPATERAFQRMWAGQERTGPAAGAWLWTSVDLDPWETADSPFYGAALAALAAGSAPGAYQAKPEIRENMARLKSYLERAQSSQPLHNRLALMWAAEKLPAVLAARDRQAILREVRRKQAPDGGWSLESLGSFKPHASAPISQGSNAYATAWTAFVMERAGIDRADRTLERALAWLKSHQDAQLGFWEASSMNKPYEAGSMQIQFMRDAATGYAAAALAEVAR
jgi:squalene-hopene/tetraprenyl-beta-curcumene cyclase